MKKRRKFTLGFVAFCITIVSVFPIFCFQASSQNYKKVIDFDRVFTSDSKMEVAIANKIDPIYQSMIGKSFNHNKRFKKLISVYKGKEGKTIVDALIQTNNIDELKSIEGLRIGSVHGDIVTASFDINKISDIAELKSTKYVESSKKLSHQLDVSAKEVGVDDIWRSGIGYNGMEISNEKNVIVGIIDSGIDWEHPDFIDNDETHPSTEWESRILFIWDQKLSPESSENHPSGFDYGVEYNNEDINSELQGLTRGSIRTRDEKFHGTHVAGIAAGDGSSTAGGYIGMAPESKIIVCAKSGLSLWNYGEENGDLFKDENDGTIDTKGSLDGIKWMIGKANQLSMPLVVNMSLGVNTGPHDGTTLYEKAINNNRELILVVPAGNSGNKMKHAKAVIDKGETHIFKVHVEESHTCFDSGEIDMTPKRLQFWYNGKDKFKVRIKPGNYSWTDSFSLSDSLSHYIEFETNDIITDAVSIVHRNSALNGDNLVDILISEVGASTKEWLFEFEDEDSESNKKPVHGYIERNIKLRFNSDVDEDGTICMPGSAKEVITVGAFTTKTEWSSIIGDISMNGDIGTLSPFSSRGPLRNEELKPDITAPGMYITSSFSKDAEESCFTSTDQINEYTISENEGRYHWALPGTSMASPHVAGAIALLLQNFPNLTRSEIKLILQESASNSGNSNEWGTGKVDIKNAYRYLVGYTGYNTPEIELLFKEAYAKNSAFIDAYPIEPVQANWCRQGLYKQRLTEGAIFYNNASIEAYRIGEDIWDIYSSSFYEDGQALLGLPLTSQYFDSATSEFKVDFQYGNIAIGYFDIKDKVNLNHGDLLDNWSKSYVEGLVKNQIWGFDNGFENNFEISELVKRKEVAKMVVLAAYKKDLMDINVDGVPFPDVRPDDPDLVEYFPYIQTLKNLDIVHGFSDGNFHPERNIARAQLAVILAQSFNLPVPNQENNCNFRKLIDLDQEWYLDAVEKLVDNYVLPEFFDDINSEYREEIAKGRSPNRFHPDGTVNRAELAKFIMNCFWFDESRNVRRECSKKKKSSNNYKSIDETEYQMIGGNYEQPPLSGGNPPISLTFEDGTNTITIEDNTRLIIQYPDFVDEDGDELFFYWVSNGGKLLSNNSAHQSVTFIPPVVDIDTEYKIYTVAGDWNGNIGKGYFTIKVVHNNSPINLVITSPHLNHAFLKPGEEFELCYWVCNKGGGSPDNAIASFSIDGYDFPTTQEVVPVTDTTIPYSPEHITLTIPNGLDSGENNIRILLDGDESSAVEVPVFIIQKSFPDVVRDDWFYDYTMSLTHTLNPNTEEFVINGYSDGTFKPGNEVNRAEFSAMVFNAAELSVIDNPSCSFSDVPSGEWFAKYILSLCDMEVVNGYKDADGNLTGEFGPGDVTTRSQACKILIDAFGFPLLSSGVSSFPDVGSDYPYIAEAEYRGFVHGYLNGNFGPNDPLTRAQAAKIIYLARKLRQIGGVRLPSANNYDPSFQTSGEVHQQTCLALENACDLIRPGTTITITMNEQLLRKRSVSGRVAWTSTGGQFTDTGISGTIEWTAPYVSATTTFQITGLLYNNDGKVSKRIMSVTVEGGLDEDTDNDGLPDSWEMEHFGNLDQDAASDYDNDGLPNGWELEYGLDPANPNDAGIDTDNDGYSNLEEFHLDSNPNDPNDPPCGISDPDTNNNPKKVTICHKGHTITISRNALQAHLNKHGDTIGPCPVDCETSWMRMEVGPEAEAVLYDPDGVEIGEFAEADGNQSLVMLGLPNGGYRIVFRGRIDGKGKLKIIAKKGDGAITEIEQEVDLKKHQVMKTILRVDPATGEIVAEDPRPSMKPDGTPLHYDYDGDDDIDIDDIEKVEAVWNICRGEGLYNEFFDIDEDGCITVSDIMKVSSEYFVP